MNLQTFFFLRFKWCSVFIGSKNRKKIQLKNLGGTKIAPGRYIFQMKQNNFVFRQKVFDDYRDGSINNIVNYGDDGTTQLPRKKAPKFDADAHVFFK